MWNWYHLRIVLIGGFVCVCVCVCLMYVCVYVCMRA